MMQQRFKNGDTPSNNAHMELGKHVLWQNTLKNRPSPIAQRIKKVAK